MANQRSIKGFIYSTGVNAEDYPLASNLKSMFIDDDNQPVTSFFYPYDNILTEISLRDFEEFLKTIERSIHSGKKVKISGIKITASAVLINPYTKQQRLFLREV